ncbi:unnamed protein product [Dracunculus medinensis]|uniref:G_PROTEIN_RECEP_F1_2 domain-containing protein n=1 Tax=Dracunculus medinensis TaxID=318479 RepID=A0A0N4UR29_DRAME|nr:unnamed protein product [Dracunculus medinensis]
MSRKFITATLTARDHVLQSIFSNSFLSRSRKSTKAERRARKAFRTITFIVGFFAILWSPYYIMATIYGFCKGHCIPGILYNLTYYMCYLNSSGNPFAYALANRQFRLAFLKMFHSVFNKDKEPFQATIYGFCKGHCIPGILYNLTYYMCYLNSSGNPFAYALANRQFRLAFLKMFHSVFNKDK